VSGEIVADEQAGSQTGGAAVTPARMADPKMLPQVAWLPTGNLNTGLAQWLAGSWQPAS